MKIPESKEEHPYQRDLGDGLVLKTAASEDDIERVVKCSLGVFREEGIGRLHRKLFLHHPSTKISDLIFVEDEKINCVVSTLCLIPWAVSYEDVRLKVGEMGIVGTLEPYRRRGLIRVQAEFFRELLIQRGFDMSMIQGIPHFYRQFGYEYALPLEGGYRVELHQVSEPGEDEKSRFSFRPETASDIPILKRLYHEAAQEFSIHACRDNEIWQYLLEHSPDTQTAFEGWVVEEIDKGIAGYFHIQKFPFGNSLTVNEVSRMNYEVALAVLRQTKKLAVERNKPDIRLNLPLGCVIAQVARYHGAYDLGNYAWQILIPDMARFLRTIGPVLERRLAGSPFADLNETLKFNFYKETAQLQFTKGKLTQVQMIKYGDGAVRIPPRAAVPLIFGYRSREELQRSWPDLGMPPRESYLIDFLFPKMSSCIYPNY